VEHGVQIDFLQWNGQPIAKVASPQLTGTVATRRAQLKAYDSPRAVAFAGAVVRGKVRNQANTLKYFAKARRQTDRRLYDALYARSEEMVLSWTRSRPTMLGTSTRSGPPCSTSRAARAPSTGPPCKNCCRTACSRGESTAAPPTWSTAC